MWGKCSRLRFTFTHPAFASGDRQSSHHALTDQPSRPGESHPEPLTDSDMRLSPHPARATPRKPTGFRRVRELLRLTVDSSSTWVTCSLCSTGITPFHRSYEAVRPWSVYRYFRPRGFSTWAFSFSITNPVLKLCTKARIRVMPSLRRTPPGQLVGVFQADPRAEDQLRFWCRLSSFRRFVEGSLALISHIPT